MNIHQKQIFDQVNNTFVQRVECSSYIQNQIIEGLHLKITYLTQQINEYKLLVSKLEKQSSQKYKNQIQQNRKRDNESLEQMLDRSIIKSLNRDKLSLRHSQKQLQYQNQSKVNDNSNKLNFYMFSIMKLFDVSNFQQLIPNIKQKLKRLVKLQTFADCIAQIRSEVSYEISKPKSLKQNWKWIKQVISKSKYDYSSQRPNKKLI